MLPDIDTILYASDISEGSRPAFRMAVKQALENNARIVFLHAIEPINTEQVEDYLPANASRKHTAQLMDNYKSRIETRIQTFLDSELETGSQLPQPPIVKVISGKPDKVILRAAIALQASLIVMGDREISTISRVFLGSTAQKVIHQSSVPVLIVPLKK
jgi:nucleotide-binding universal stress UspA family protein